MYLITVFLSLMILLVILKIMRKRQKDGSMPCPPGYPLIGPILQLAKMGDRPHILMENWAKELGDIYNFYIFGRQVIVLNSVDTIYEALVKKGKCFSGNNFSIIVNF